MKKENRETSSPIGNFDLSTFFVIGNDETQEDYDVRLKEFRKTVKECATLYRGAVRSIDGDEAEDARVAKRHLRPKCIEAERKYGPRNPISEVIGYMVRDIGARLSADDERMSPADWA
ncbi:hypothetical protein CMI41_04605 [Candidatus Pacearchaeota archaeon]|nr:hypothetical protein [Candidatus Pacearchaeota archaeon]|tara:strand:+ start:17010 stop:17363 length:354 start_codon:yes stop_codon:yes gene_type:complete